MADKTKTCNLTEDEISHVLASYGFKLGSRDFTDEDIERINYLNKRLKAFKEPETSEVSKSDTNAEQQTKIPAASEVKGWGSTNG